MPAADLGSLGYLDAMRIFLLVFVSLAALSCSGHRRFDAAAATRWSQSADVQSRNKATTYSFQRHDGSWVCISTTPLKESDSGFVYGGAAVLKTGFLVYPGAHRAKSITDAVEIASKISGLHLKS